MKNPTDDMLVSKGCKITLTLYEPMRYGVVKMIVKNFRAQLRKTTVSKFGFAIELESPEYNGSEKIFRAKDAEEI